MVLEGERDRFLDVGTGQEEDEAAEEGEGGNEGEARAGEARVESIVQTGWTDER